MKYWRNWWHLSTINMVGRKCNEMKWNDDLFKLLSYKVVAFIAKSKSLYNIDFPKFPCILTTLLSAWGTLSHTRKLPAVTHVLHLLAAWKVTSQQCYLAWVAAPKEPLVQWGSEIRPSLDFECSKRVGLPMVWILKGIWNREAQPFEIRTNDSHLVKNHLKLDKNVQISKSLVFK